MYRDYGHHTHTKGCRQTLYVRPCLNVAARHAHAVAQPTAENRVEAYKADEKRLRQ